MRFCLFILLFVPQLVIAQKWVAIDDDIAPIDRKDALMRQPAGTLGTDTTEIKQFLMDEVDNLKAPNVGLALENFAQSPKAKHYRFVQTLNGRKVFRGSVKLNVGNDGKILSLFDHTFGIQNDVDATFPDHGPYHEGLAVHYREPHNGILDHYNLEEVYFEENGLLIPAIRLEVAEKTDRYYELVLNKDVKVVYQNDLLCYAAPQDTTVTVWVFNPDPLTTAHQNYGAPYADAGDQDILQLNAERIAVEVPATFENDTFFLRNDFVQIRDFSFPDVAPVTSITPEFNYTRAESGFEDGNAFYHLTTFQQYIQSLGFTDLANYRIDVDPHALNGADNSNFNGAFNPPQLKFGEGGVDDAEDADVIIHEYGHAISNSAAPNTNVGGSERSALDEALGDYFASSYSRYLSTFRWADVFTWDGHNEYWGGRSSVSNDHYPEDLTNNLYGDADIWSATLMQIWGDIGREATDAIMLQTTYSFATGMTMPQAALAFIQADTLLFGGAHHDPIYQRMFDRGLLPASIGIDEVNPQEETFRVFNTKGFASGTQPLRIVSDKGISANLYNALGQRLQSYSAPNGVLHVPSNGLQSGVYILELSNDKDRKAIKLVKN
ncbi:MAG: T9SS type A sorting domain-containing protein [Flavobacteriales bacterium]|nr:T9SS type A sorting domain-containing protein [Flavobacteriales bacterium]